MKDNSEYFSMLKRMIKNIPNRIECEHDLLDALDLEKQLKSACNAGCHKIFNQGVTLTVLGSTIGVSRQAVRKRLKKHIFQEAQLPLFSFSK